MKRVCIKAGSSILTESNGRLNVEQIAAIVRQIVKLVDNGIEVLLVSSGAVAAGKGILKLSNNDVVSKRQLWSAVGQVHLMNLYERLFREYGYHCAQVLVTKQDFNDRQHFLNMRNCFQIMLQNKVIPIVNENDTVAITELMFTDNDELAGLLSSMTNSDALYILSNVNGLYKGILGDPQSELIQKIYPENDFSSLIQASKSSFGRGGMHTKYRICSQTAKNGIDVYIANGSKDSIILDLVAGKTEDCTHFVAGDKINSSVKSWLAMSSKFAKAKVVVDFGAEQALNGDQAASLLMVGVKDVIGDFEIGDVIEILSENNNLLAVGKAGFGSKTAEEYIGKKHAKPLVHYDFLYMVEKDV